MKDCPEQPTYFNCGYKAAQYLAEGRHVVIDPLDKANPIVMAAAAVSVLEVIQIEAVEKIDIVTDVARFGCVACGRKVEIIDDDGDLRAAVSEKT